MITSTPNPGRVKVIRKAIVELHSEPVIVSDPKAALGLVDTVTDYDSLLRSIQKDGMINEVSFLELAGAMVTVEGSEEYEEYSEEEITKYKNAFGIK